MRRVLPIIGLFLLAACTTFRVLDSADPATLGKELEAGDRVIATMDDDRRYELDFVSIEEASILGERVEEGSKGERIRLPRSELRSIEVKRISWGRTLALVLGIGAFFAFSLAVYDAPIGPLFQ